MMAIVHICVRTVSIVTPRRMMRNYCFRAKLGARSAQSADFDLTPFRQGIGNAYQHDVLTTGFEY